MLKKNGELANNKHDILKRWSQHVQELFEIKKIDNSEDGILREKLEEEEEEEADKKGKTKQPFDRRSRNGNRQIKK